MKLVLNKSDKILFGVVHAFFIDIELHADMVDFNCIVIQTNPSFSDMENKPVLIFIEHGKTYNKRNDSAGT